MSKRRIRYAPPKGPVAIAPKAWGAEFEIAFGDDAPKTLYTEEGDYAVVTIAGPLMQRDSFFGDNYESIRARMASAFASDKSAVCMRISSPGGDFVGCIELARDLRTAAKASGKKLVAFTDSEALSAAYALASAGETLVTTETASVGSIGVWVPRIDVTAQDAMMGLRVAIVASGVAKSDRNPHVAMTDEGITRLQQIVDEQADMFFELIAEHRGMAVSKVKALDGAEFFGQRAIATGLADVIVNSWSSYLTNQEGPAMPPKAKASKYMDEARVALRHAAEGEDEEEKKAAEKALKALEDDKQDDGEDKEAKAKAEKEEAEKKAKAAKEEEEKAKAAAKALAAGGNELTLAQEFQAFKAQIDSENAQRAAKEEAEMRAKIYASRPDLTDAQKRAYDRVPLADAKALIELLPRISVGIGSSAAAMSPGVMGERKRETVVHLTPGEAAILEKLDRRPAAKARAEFVGTTLQMPRAMTQAQAAEYAKELEAELEGMGQ